MLAAMAIAIAGGNQTHGSTKSYEFAERNYPYHKTIGYMSKLAA